MLDPRVAGAIDDVGAEEVSGARSRHCCRGAQVVAGALRTALERPHTICDADAAVAEAEALRHELEASTLLAPLLPWLQAKHGPERATACASRGAARGGACIVSPPAPPHTHTDAPTWNAMAVLLQDGFSPCDASKFTTFGLFREDVPVPVQVRT